MTRMNAKAPFRENLFEFRNPFKSLCEKIANPTASKLKLATALAFCLSFTALYQASAQSTNVFVDPSRTWVGFMNVSQLPEDGGAPLFGSVWGTADLDASFSGSILTFSPNTSIDRDQGGNTDYWWKPDGSPNRQMDANFYVQDDALAGSTVTFSGYCWTNSLVTPYSTNTTAFIKDFAPDFSSSTVITSNLTGGFFSITLATTAGGHHIQYGFEMIGPDMRISNAPAAGSAIIASNPPPAGPVILGGFPTAPSVIVGSNISFAATTSGSNLRYQWLKNGVNLTNGPNIFGATNSTLTLSNITGDAEASYTLTVTNFSGSDSRSAYLTVLNPSHLTIDPKAPWIGFMNVFNLPQDGGGFVFNTPWSVPDLRAQFNGGTIAILPNTNVYNPVDPFWVTNGVGNKTMDAVLYQQFDGLANMIITFTGFCPTNTLDPAYTNIAFIRDFAPDFSSNVGTNIALGSGQPFSITWDMTADAPGRHIQWGFETIGPDADPATADSLGKVLVSIIPPTLTATASGNTVSLSFPTETGLGYTVQYRTNLTAGAWQTLNTVNGNGTNRIVTDSVGNGPRFYRLSAH
jgi:hypothetical protein